MSAHAVEDVTRQSAARDPDDLAAAERLEVEANGRYAAALPEDDETIAQAFWEHLARHPEAYAPL